MPRPRGLPNTDLELDALAHLIVGTKLDKVVTKMGTSRSNIYKLARQALQRLQEGQPRDVPRQAARRGGVIILPTPAVA